jgi:TPR repeat protein
VRDEARSLELARESSGKGGRYGQYVLGYLYQCGAGGLARDYAEAVAFFRLAAAQNFDGAQCSLGYMYSRDLSKPPLHLYACVFCSPLAIHRKFEGASLLCSTYLP